MVKLIQIDRLRPRIDGMLYRISFDEQWALLDEVSPLTSYGWNILNLPHCRVLANYQMPERVSWMPAASKGC
jgi:cytokinesis protein